MLKWCKKKKQRYPHKRCDSRVHDLGKDLPAEILLQIFVTAALEDRQMASKLCLINHSVNRKITPILYQRICLRRSWQVDCFKATLDLKPSFQRYIKNFSWFEEEAVNRKILVRTKEGWNHWSTFIETIASFTNLSILAVSCGVCEVIASLVHNDCDHFYSILITSDKFAEKRPKLQVDHVIITQGGYPYHVLEMINTRRLTWVGKISQVECLIFRAGFFRQMVSGQLQELNICIDDRVCIKCSIKDKKPDGYNNDRRHNHEGMSDVILGIIGNFMTGARSSLLIEQRQICSLHSPSIEQNVRDKDPFKLNIWIERRHGRKDSTASKSWFLEKSYCWRNDLARLKELPT
jgi:hypothetical protein